MFCTWPDVLIGNVAFHFNAFTELIAQRGFSYIRYSLVFSSCQTACLLNAYDFRQAGVKSNKTL